MRPSDELHTWNAVAATVLDRDIERGKASAVPDAPESDSPLLRACLDARDTLERIVRRGGYWQGEWVAPARRSRWTPEMKEH